VSNLAIFLSYHRADLDAAEQVRASLLTHRCAVWMDLYDIPAGAYWPDEIDRGLQSADVVIGVLSPDSMASRNVKNEWDWAIQNGKRLILFQTRACVISHRYISINYIDATNRSDAALDQLVQALGLRESVTVVAPSISTTPTTVEPRKQAPVENPWTDFTSGDPYVLPADLPQVLAFNRGLQQTDVRRLRLNVVPEPYIGRVDAPVVLLAINPGYTSEDVHFTNDAYARDVWQRNLLHQPLDYPFYPLDPALSWAAGAIWWTRRLRALLAASDRKTVANNLLCIEYFPYHSYKNPLFPGEVPSQAYSFDLVNRAIARGATILITRGVRAWRHRITRLRDYTHVFDTANPQNSSVFPGNFPTGFNEAVRRLLNENEKSATHPLT
jgi:hypothetical protein